MRFQVPQFIEQEAKIAGPFNFKQFVLLVLAGTSVVVLYIVLAKTNFFLFVVGGVTAFGVAISLGFVSVNGKTLPTLLADFMSFSVSPKIYLWRKKELPPKIIWKKGQTAAKKKNEEETAALKVAEKSRLKKMANKVY